MDFDRWFANQRPHQPRKMVKQLTEDAQFDRDNFHARDEEYGSLSRRGCTCCISPPCSFCVHPGNPFNQEEDDEAWELVPEDEITRDTE